MTTITTPAAGLAEIELAVTGMTCAACSTAEE
jgi:hypothetical protein